MRQVPFYSNTPDNNHCYQAAFKIVLKYFLPDKDFIIEQLEEMTAYQEGKWTWPIGGALSMINLGFDLKIFDNYDYNRFANEGENYHIERYGKELASIHIAHSNMVKEQNLAKELVRSSGVEFIRKFDLEDIRNLFDKGFLGIFNINSKAIEGSDGYVGHSVVVYDINDENIWFHDPGLPPIANRKESRSHFENAWKDTKDAYLFRLNT